MQPAPLLHPHHPTLPTPPHTHSPLNLTSPHPPSIFDHQTPLNLPLPSHTEGVYDVGHSPSEIAAALNKLEDLVEVLVLDIIATGGNVAELLSQHANALLAAGLGLQASPLARREALKNTFFTWLATNVWDAPGGWLEVRCCLLLSPPALIWPTLAVWTASRPLAKPALSFCSVPYFTRPACAYTT